MYRNKLIFILPSLRAGGAERVLSFLAMNLKISFEVKLIVIGNKSEASYLYDEDRTVFLNKERVLNGIGELYLILRKEKPSIVMTSISHLNILMGFYKFLFPKIKFIAREASVISEMNKYSISSKRFIYGIFERFRGLAYKRLDFIICQSQDMKEDLHNLYGILKSKLTVINNPVTKDFGLKVITTSEDEVLKFITIGRLSIEKGHERILKALSKIEYDFEYTIIGDGPLKEKIMEEVRQLSLESKVKYISQTRDVDHYLKQSDWFLQGSYVEGFPNAVLESCVVGIPVLAFKCPGGTREIIKSGENGFIADDQKSFEAELKNFGQGISLDPKIVRASVIKNFSAEQIIQQYVDVFNSCLK